MALLGGEGESATLNRLRDLSNEHCLIFKQDDGTRLRFRVEDFSVDERGLDWVHGSYMCTVTQLGQLEPRRSFQTPSTAMLSSLKVPIV